MNLNVLDVLYSVCHGVFMLDRVQHVVDQGQEMLSRLVLLCPA